MPTIKSNVIIINKLYLKIKQLNLLFPTKISWSGEFLSLWVVILQVKCIKNNLGVIRSSIELKYPKPIKYVTLVQLKVIPNFFE